ncbi:hypothetical protein PZB74_17620 [Porifericola rhodea]|uniref:hypothetical protein n=1 Tax=Porifericola rhodea TaxID=930972 RepID=UPI002666B127|nr:hypothetical protein [Porifericola rhodea]WKN30777.1 hypothetical protein PZB74_17620 [Porifericola rhodea]
MYRLFQQAIANGNSYVFLSALVFKLAAGLSIAAIYVYYYSAGDMLNYAQDARLLSDLFLKEPSFFFKVISAQEQVEGLIYQNQSRALFFSKVSAVLALFTLQNFWLMNLALSVANFIVCWMLIARLLKYFKCKPWVAYASFLYFPSVVFWSSGLLKESVAMGLIYVLIALFLDFYIGRKSSIGKSILFIVCAASLWFLKYYYAAALLPLLITLLTIGSVGKKPFTRFQKWRFFALGAMVVLVLLTLITQLHPNLKPDFVLEAIVRNHKLSIAASEAEGYIGFSQLEPNLYSFIINSPKAIFGGLFLPLFKFEGAAFLASLENLIFLIIFSYALAALFRKKRAWQHTELIFAAIVYIIFLSLLIALASPNYGSLSRYKVAYTPFCLFLCLLIISESQVFFSRFQSKKKI